MSCVADDDDASCQPKDPRIFKSSEAAKEEVSAEGPFPT